MRYRKPRGSLIAHSASKKVGSDSATKLQTRSARQLTSNSALWLLALAARLHPECGAKECHRNRKRNAMLVKSEAANHEFRRQRSLS